MAWQLDIFINQTFNDLLGSRGFKKRGRTYRLTSPTGDQVLFNISSNPRQGTVQYFVLTVAIAPIIMLDYYHHTLHSPLNRQLSMSDWIATSHIASPQKPYSTYVPMYWSFDGEAESIEVSKMIQERLSDGLLSRIIGLLDRRSLLALARQDRGNRCEWALPWNRLNTISAEILLLVQDGQSDELHAAMLEAEKKGFYEIIDWANSYLGRHPH